jgi:hypothetical protein
MIRAAALTLILLLGSTTPSLAWGALGHRLVSASGEAALPSIVPDFLRSAAAVAEVGDLGPEADRLKSSGKTWNSDDDPGHFVDLADDGTAGGLALTALPSSREAFDTALRTAGTDQYKIGFLPYELIDGYQQITTDLAYWRVFAYGAVHAASSDDRAFFAFEKTLRETLALRDIGYWSHFVGDASQPLHVSIHFNGWKEKYPHLASDPHGRFETALVRAGGATQALVRARMTPYTPWTGTYEAHVAAYLTTTLSFMPRVYALDATGAIDGHTPDAVNLMLDRLAAGASMLRDSLADSWTESDTKKIGYPAVAVSDIESGAKPITKALFAGD